MNVTFLCDKLNLSRGGSNHSLDLLAHRLTIRGHNVSVVTLNFIHNNDLPDSPSYDVITDPVQKTSTSGKAREIYQSISKYDNVSDILHAFNPALLPLVGHYRNRGGETPVVGRLNTYDSFCTNLSRMDSTCYQNCSVKKKFEHDDRRSAEKLTSVPRYVFDTHSLPRLANGVDRFFALSPTVADVYEEIGFDKDRIYVIPNCLDPEFGERATATPPFEDERQTILYVGRIGEQKGVDLLIDALDYLSSPSGYRIEVVGDGQRRDQLQQRIAQLNLADQIRFHGWVEHAQLPGYYAEADLFVHPGRWPEPFGRTILEAMQCDTPVVVSDVGAPPWIVDSREAIFERNNASDLARTIERVIENPSQITDSYPSRLRKFSPERVVSDIETNYRQLVESGSKAG